ncbi:hypothetical protein LEP1GSC198_3608 [Leptospira kirschneri str. JB]|nr:hypothetical protein LEP1GSC198_3608 [Leptospira kirschneri str. JB]
MSESFEGTNISKKKAIVKIETVPNLQQFFKIQNDLICDSFCVL